MMNEPTLLKMCVCVCVCVCVCSNACLLSFMLKSIVESAFNKQPVTIFLN
ncbi:MAG: hypothetical protein ACRC4N_04215 [Gammaproteobacteria bacterium]